LIKNDDFDGFLDHNENAGNPGKLSHTNHLSENSQWVKIADYFDFSAN
jgi:hypothetical protein